MANEHQRLAEEFLDDDWASYALAELDRGGRFRGDTPETVERLDRMTRVLYHGSAAAVKRAVDLLEPWLEEHPTHERTLAFRLRYVLCLKKQGKEHKALVALEPLLQAQPTSAALVSLKGVLHGWLRDYDKALEAFNRAIELDGDWVEPHLEKLEKTIFVSKYAEAVDQADRGLKMSTITPREELIRLTYRLIASVLKDLSYFNTDHYKARVKDIQEITIEKKYREDWYVEPIWKHIREQTRAILPPEVQKALYEVLVEAHKKLMATDKGFDW